MQSLKVTLILGLFFLFSLVSLALFFNLDGEANFSSLATRSTDATKKNSATGSREFEKSEVISKTDKVENEPSALFNDPAIKQAWGLKKSDAARAWKVTKGSKDIIVAVIDTGIDIHHEDLKDNLWKNPGEIGLDKNGKDKSTNNIDDDKNGYVDDVYGWNFVSNTADLTDNHGHGTHIAGIIGAMAGNQKGISGIAPDVSLMIIKYYDPKVTSTDNLKNTINSINYAIKMGAQIINYSGGGTDYSQDEFDAVKKAEKNGILFVAAAGNERSNSDQFHYYPADYKLSNIISVTALDPSKEVLASSNFGIETVDLAAPGQNIISTLPGNSYGFMTGTSQATAFVSGAAVLVKANKTEFKFDDIKRYILSTGDPSTTLAQKTRTSRSLNLFKSLTILDQGMSANGIVVSTPVNEVFTTKSDAKLNPDSSTGSLFGKSLLEAVQKSNPKPRLGGKKDSQDIP
ncbi:MAG: S8 family serine peptidase [Bdellovibrionaceae bacterium]|nr:S8 family serine peptidase [Pseudobdellovibrionaceae bacterium]